MGLVDNPMCSRCGQALEVVLHVLCDSEALAELRFKYLCWHFLEPGDIDDVFISGVLQFVQSVGLLNV